ncbi:ECF-type sigma factor [Caldimonas brevitalea]|uniref:RNA polymerase sigma-70 ECF-like HTH domain-containing protein n=1 Tax=Caldimonas brevitalea TaxID=413882 RepID=A0A0G3BFW5_9BURK|nr:ECF-type sigma factor [Caldimonas brevitalea]AKJ26843.1 hypothetical protein AAW51_0152 [Caldimonas brevitalea]
MDLTPHLSKPDDSPADVTRLLRRWSQGDRSALDRVLPLVYGELRRMAGRVLRSETAARALQQPTELVHEAYLRMVRLRHSSWPSRAFFYAWVMRLMRRILIDQARAAKADKRGGGGWQQSLEALREDGLLPAVEAQLGVEDEGPYLVALQQALDRLTQLDPQQGRVVELRFFVGLSVEETAVALKTSIATVLRKWAAARKWLLDELGWAPGLGHAAHTGAL